MPGLPQEKKTPVARPASNEGGTGLVAYALKRPHTIVALVILIVIIGVGAVLRMPIDIFPEIDIPVVSVVWTYNGMNAEEIQDLLLIPHERQLASLVDDISRVEADSYNGVGVIKVYLHEGANVSRAISQLSSCAETVLKYMPPNTTPPLIVRYGATDVPIIQLSLSSRQLPDQRLTDFGQQVLRPDLAVVHGAQVTYPYGGKPRVIMVDLNMDALRARQMTPDDVINSLASQNLQAPSGDAKIGSIDYTIPLNNSTKTIDALNDFPVRTVGNATIFLRDVAHVHDGYVVQTNAVNLDGKPAALVTIRKTGGVSTLSVIGGVRKALPDIERLLPKGMSIKPLFDQSIFVNAALGSVIMGGLMAAALTAVMIFLFLGNWKLTLIILASIPLSMITALLVMSCLHQTLNTMTLGGFALAVGILVDNSTVVIENIERWLRLGNNLGRAVIIGAGEVAVPTMLATLAICLVFIPVFLLEGTAKYLFSPMSLSVIVSLLASLLLSFTLVPVLFRHLMASQHPGIVKEDENSSNGGASAAASADKFETMETGVAGRSPTNIFSRIHHAFENGFNNFRENYRNTVSWATATPLPVIGFFALLIASSFLVFPWLGMNFFPSVDAGQMRLHVHAPAGTRIEKTQEDFAKVETAIREIVGNHQIDTILDNIGLPYSGINIALSDSATVGPMDGEILISLKKNHAPTAQHMAELRRELSKRFPSFQFFFQPADIVNQVLNFGQAAPIDIQVVGPDSDKNYAAAARILHDIRAVPGLVDAHIFQVRNVPALNIRVDRTLAGQLGMTQRDILSSVLISLDSSAMVSPNFWLNPKSSITYPLLVQTPTYQVNSLPSLLEVPVSRDGLAQRELLMNIAKIKRGTAPMILSQLNIRPVFDAQANVQGRDLGRVSRDLRRIIARDTPPASTGVHVTLGGQIETMTQSFNGLFGGMALAVAFVFLLMVIQFQSWLDPLIVLAAVPTALVGVVWMLFLTQTPISVPALMGSLMCIGLTTANSILVVTFANQRTMVGDDSRSAAVAAGFTRLRPVLMTAGAMILGMVPMAFGVGEGGEQNAPLARAVIGGLFFATFATLILVPTLYRLVHQSKPQSRELEETIV
jgi:multidrug efflux pump subunit AcrB